MTQLPTIPVHFILLPGFLLLDFAGPAEALRIANQHGGRFELHYCGPEAMPQSSLGMALDGIAPLPGQLPAQGWVIIPGLAGAMAAQSAAAARHTVAWLQQLCPAGHPWPHGQLITICSAALLAGAAGLLDHRRCTTHHTLVEKLQQIAPNARVENDRVFVLDGEIASSAGITTGIDLALELIARQCGPQLALAVAREMVVWLRRDSATPQHSPFLAYRNHLHPAVHRVQDAISAEPARPWPLEAMANVACVSPRHLARLFRQHAGVSPLDYYQQIQLAQIEPLLTLRDWSLERIAEAGGFGSARDLRRVWQKQRTTPLRRPVEAH
ncbi:GlxA family transcriptional regulator [Chitinimonas sp. JJ19]|uniref:GlxA family transcriptional regulator n=1 Tax=Chitinimonas sp. JJ19 TaxID=3109352 RepID=UPI003000C6B6